MVGKKKRTWKEPNLSRGFLRLSFPVSLLLFIETRFDHEELHEPAGLIDGVRVRWEGYRLRWVFFVLSWSRQCFLRSKTKKLSPPCALSVLVSLLSLFQEQESVLTTKQMPAIFA